MPAHPETAPLAVSHDWMPGVTLPSSSAGVGFPTPDPVDRGTPGSTRYRLDVAHLDVEPTPESDGACDRECVSDAPVLRTKRL